MIKDTAKIIGVFIYAVLLGSCSPKQTYLANVFDDNLHLMDYHVKGGRISREVYFDKSRKTKQEIVYNYDKFGELQGIDLLGDSSISGLDGELVVKLYKDAIVQKKFLDSLEVNIPLLPINKSELNDISDLLSTAKSIKSTVSGKLRILEVDSIGKKYRFSASSLERFISPSDIVEKYTIKLCKGVVVNEEIVFGSGRLVRNYFWSSSVEFNISIEFRDKDSKTYFTHKKVLIKRDF